MALPSTAAGESAPERGMPPVPGPPVPGRRPRTHATRPIADDTPKISLHENGAVDALIRGTTERTYRGDGIYNASGANQICTQAAALNLALPYDVLVQNEGTQPAIFVVSGPGSGDGWRVQYFDASEGDGTDITAQVTRDGWKTPQLASGDMRLLRVTLTPDKNASMDVPRKVPLRVATADGKQTDGVQAIAQLQKLGKMQLSLDHRQSWVDVDEMTGPETPVVAQNSMVSFRVVPAKTGVPWPLVPEFKPTWSVRGQEHIGDEITVHFPDVTAPDSPGVKITAECGNYRSTYIKVRPAYDLDAWSDPGALRVDGTPAKVQVFVNLHNNRGEAVPGVKIHFSSRTKNGTTLGQINGQSTSDDWALTDAKGEARVTLTSDKAGDATVRARVMGPKGDMWEETTTNVAFLAPPSRR